jgi:exportin-2 (importin alpha re-exporter)
MVAKFATGDFHVINGVLQTAVSIFEKYSFEMKSQKLWEEIKFVLDNFSQPFTDLLNKTMALANEHANNAVALKVIFGSLVLIAKIFYFLNYQDLPEYFEDNMAVWMTHFLALLEADNKVMGSVFDLLLTRKNSSNGNILKELYYFHGFFFQCVFCAARSIQSSFSLFIQQVTEC